MYKKILVYSTKPTNLITSKGNDAGPSSDVTHRHGGEGRWVVTIETVMYLLISSQVKEAMLDHPVILHTDTVGKDDGL